MNNSIPPLIQSRLDAIANELGELSSAKEKTAAEAEGLYAKVRDIEVRIEMLKAEHAGLDLWRKALGLEGQPEDPALLRRKPKVMVEAKALPLLKSQGPMDEKVLLRVADVEEDAFHAWVQRAQNNGKITRSEDGTLEAL